MKDGKRLLAYMQSKGYRIRAINIVYLEDVNADTWQPVAQPKLDVWDDARILLRNTGEVLLSCKATTEPGGHYTYNRMNPKGAARIAFGQHKDAWKLGDHKGQYALVQCAPLKVHRDANEDGLRTSDAVDIGFFGLNQHTTGRAASASVPLSIGHWSAGCLVGQSAATHYNLFMPVLKWSGNKTFDTAVIAGDEFHRWTPKVQLAHPLPA